MIIICEKINKKLFKYALVLKLDLIIGIDYAECNNLLNIKKDLDY